MMDFTLLLTVALDQLRTDGTPKKNGTTHSAQALLYWTVATFNTHLFGRHGRKHERLTSAYLAQPHNDVIQEAIYCVTIIQAL